MIANQSGMSTINRSIRIVDEHNPKDIDNNHIFLFFTLIPPRLKFIIIIDLK